MRPHPLYPRSRARVLRVYGMPPRARMCVDNQQPYGAVTYIRAEEFTERQARLLEAAQNGDVSIEQLLAEWAS